jgi:HEAT repeat protein/predicted transcriptional regulator
MKTKRMMLTTLCVILAVLFGCSQEEAKQGPVAVAPMKKPAKLPVVKELKKAPITPVKKLPATRSQEAEEILKEWQKTNRELDAALHDYGKLREKMDAARKEGAAKREAGRKLTEDAANLAKLIKATEGGLPRIRRQKETEEQKKFRESIERLNKAFPTKEDKIDPSFDLEGAIAGLSSPDSNIRKVSIKGIDAYNIRKNRTKTRAATKSLCDLLESEADKAIRFDAVCLLANLTDENGLVSLAKVLQGDPKKYDAEIREKASRGVGYIRNEQARDILLKTLTTDPDEGVRANIALALSGFKGEEVVDGLIAALPKEDATLARECIVRTLGKFKTDEATESVISALKGDENDEVRHWAAFVLKSNKNPNVPPALITALDDEYWDVRKNAAESLGYNMSSSAIKPLIKTLKDKEPSVKSAAATALGSISGKNDVSEAVEPLIECLEGFDKKDSFYIRPVLFALGKIKDPRAVVSVSRLLKEEEYEKQDIRQAAAICLGNIQDPSAIDILSLAAKNDSSERVKKAAQKALDKLQ